MVGAGIQPGLRVLVGRLRGFIGRAEEQSAVEQRLVAATASKNMRLPSISTTMK
jgi:hypothetical protein